MWIVVTGNPIDGFEYIGPFDDKENAIRYADRKCAVDWWLGDLEHPDAYETLHGSVHSGNADGGTVNP